MEGGFAFRALELYLTQVAALKRDFSPEFQLNSREILKWKPLHGEKETHREGVSRMHAGEGWRPGGTLVKEPVLSH